MGKISQITIFIFIILLGFNSCSKDDEPDAHQEFKDKYFEVTDASFINEEMPGASNTLEAPTIQTIFGNHSVLSGGSNVISIGSTSDVAYILIGIEGITGYYKLAVGDSENITEDLYLLYVLMSQNLELQNFNLMVALLSSDNLISEYSEVQISQIEAGTGLLQINCTWDKLNDVDLHLFEPSGEEIYYNNKVSDNGGELDVDSNAGCYIDEINNENITYSENSIVEDGQYSVNVDLYSNCDITGGTNYIVTAYYNGDLISTSTGSNPYTGTFVASDVYEDNSNPENAIMKFTINSNKSASTDRVSLLKFKYPENKRPISNKPEK